MWHIVDPFGSTIIVMHGRERTDVVGLAIVIPSDDFNKSGTKRKNFVPSIVPEEIRWEDPVLAVRNLCSVMSVEPRGNRGHVWLGTESCFESDISIGNSNGGRCIRSFVVSVVVPSLLPVS